MPFGSEFDFDSLFSYNYYHMRDPSEDDDDEVDVNVAATEETPLLAVGAAQQNAHSTVTDIAIILALVAVLLGGVSIAVYLMVIQQNEDHVLPPVAEQPARRVNVSDRERPGSAAAPAPPFRADTVFIEQTGTGECRSLQSCAPILRDIKAKSGVNNALPYNFVLSSDGTAYEGLGWPEPSPLYSEPKPLVLQFIGNFVNASPNVEQVELTKSLISEFLRRDILVKNYTVSGDLYDKFKDSPQWKGIGSGFLYSI